MVATDIRDFVGNGGHVSLLFGNNSQSMNRDILALW
jgi:hypothetical protein